jgi:hypothetical protein
VANALFYSNVAQQTTLSGSISSGSTSINVGATTGFPSTPFILALDFGAATEELVSVSAVAGTTLTCTRGYGGTSAQSHSLGAVVRHVYNAQDATDFRTHEASTGAVHGLTGSIVGTSDTQTLSAKTLTNPTINAAALSGTFTGNPTLSGNATFSGTLTGAGGLAGTFTGGPTFSGAPLFTGGPNFNSAAPANASLSTAVTGDAFDRLRIQSDGKHLWGPGSGTRDTNLYRSGIGILSTDNAFFAAGTITGAPTSTVVDALAANLPSGTAGDLLNLRVNNAIQAAMGNDGQFRTYGGNSPTPWVTTVTNQGSATFNTNNGWYWRVGKMVYVNIYLGVNVAGSGTGLVTVTMPSNVDRTTRQCLLIHSESNGAGSSGQGSELVSAIRGGECVFFTSGSGATSDRIRIDLGSGNEANLQGSNLLAGGLIAIQGWYREA